MTKKKEIATLSRRYPQCRSTVYIPSAYFNEGVEEGITTAPIDSDLDLSFVYGYHNVGSSITTNTANILYLKSGEMVYYSSAVVVVYNSATGTQRLLRRHDDEVTCLAAHPNGVLLASGQSGRVSGKIVIWDTGAAAWEG